MKTPPSLFGPKQWQLAIYVLKTAPHHNENDEWLLYRLASVYLENGEKLSAKTVATSLWESGMRTKPVKSILDATATNTVLETSLICTATPNLTNSAATSEPQIEQMNTHQ